MISSDLEPSLNELLGALDEEAQLLEQKRSQLTDLFRALMDRNEEATEAVLGEIERAQSLQVSADFRLSEARRILAEVLGYPVAGFKLSKLIALLPPAWAQPLGVRRQRILTLTGALRREHLRTATLLGECIRVNRALLSCLLPAGEPVVTYSTGGADVWRPETGIMDSES